MATSAKSSRTQARLTRSSYRKRRSGTSLTDTQQGHPTADESSSVRHLGPYNSAHDRSGQEYRSSSREVVVEVVEDSLAVGDNPQDAAGLWITYPASLQTTQRIRTAVLLLRTGQRRRRTSHRGPPRTLPSLPSEDVQEKILGLATDNCD